MSRHAPAALEQRRAHIFANRLTPGSLAFDTALDAIATVEKHTAAGMTKIRYEDPEIVRLHGIRKTVNPTRLRLAQLDDLQRKRQGARSRAAQGSPERVAEQIVERWLETFANPSTSGIDELKAAIAQAILVERDDS